MPPTKKSRTRSPPKTITEGESVMIASLLCIFFRISQSRHCTTLMSPIHNTSLSQLVEVRQYYDNYSGQNDPIIIHYLLNSCWPRPLHTTPPHCYLPALSEGPVQSRVSWLLKATVHRQPSQADCQSGPGPQKEKNEWDKLQRECLLYQLHGNIDLIQQKKTPLTKDQITVLASGATARTVLIEGAPGIGKTTLLWQLCHQWADGELLQQWELVILVQLRDETTRTAQCLSDLLYHPRQNISRSYLPRNRGTWRRECTVNLRWVRRTIRWPANRLHLHKVTTTTISWAS